MPRQPIIKPEPTEDYEDGEYSHSPSEGDEDFDLFKGALPHPSAIRYRTIDLFEMMQGPYLILDPPYQRDVVWTKLRMSGLIHSMLHEFYVPPIIFSLSRILNQNNSKPRITRTVVDGKQRLSSIKAFMLGQIPYLGRNETKYFYTLENVRERGAKLLPENARQKFKEQSLLCIEYKDLKAEQEEDLFQRVQMGIPLTSAEKLQAVSGKWKSFIKELQAEYTRVNDREFSTLFPRRALCEDKSARDFQAFAIILFVLHCTKPTDLRPAPWTNTPSRLMSFIKDTPEPTLEFRARARAVFGIFDKMIENSPDVFTHQYTFWSNQVVGSGKGSKKEKAEVTHARRFSPIELYATGILIDKMKEIKTPRASAPGKGHGVGSVSVETINALSREVNSMRQWIREKALDLRSNTQTWNKLSQYITEAGERWQRCVERGVHPGDVRSEVVADGDEDEEEMVIGMTEEEAFNMGSAGSAGKRKADGDGEWGPASRRRMQM
ncbi:hypothetical protein SAICODRAFT_4361 [Saitoella complicata NRRL Y-17804]|uniref:uncharacterized protein n=1 Tax=Saitoella complicata (strain BCRC 22490 / CBS 7301 / JCM 7358 / NBRC 10748 / NRRL Y-17804) TaxID=698492 RepID=UPI000867ACAB|nr:uncharacterized protein SAICODRAFT_4361 [Saitoella complicata NRRL Y-17804]ODQ56166.1 hypothetical protein SAICODRAFT_4361 [Saitoella complicata NRRL Y-17804]